MCRYLPKQLLDKSQCRLPFFKYFFLQYWKVSVHSIFIFIFPNCRHCIISQMGPGGAAAPEGEGNPAESGSFATIYSVSLTPMEVKMMEWQHIL